MAQRSGLELSGWLLRLAQAAWISLVLLTLALFVVGVSLQLERLNRGVFGFDIEKSPSSEFVLTPTPGLAAAAEGMRHGDVLLTAEGIPSSPQDSTADVIARLNRAGTQLRVDVRGTDGVVRQLVLVRDVGFLTSQGISPRIYALLLVAPDVILVLGSIAIALLIFARKSNDGLALLASLEVVLLSARVTDETATVALTYPQLAWVGALLVYVGVAVLPMTFALFPNGKFVPRWTILYVPLGFIYAFFVVSVPSELTFSLTLGSLRGLLDIVFVGVGVVAQIVRYRWYSTPREKQQTKWIVFGITLAFAVFYLSGLPRLFLPELNDSVALSVRYRLFQSPLIILSILLVPITLAISIFRSHLWDIDILIRRTVTYTLLTALLLVVYFFSIVVLQKVFAGFSGAGNNDIVTVLSTLGIAALFVPLRSALQATIDKRFNRKKYDAQQILAKFAITARDETDLAKLSSELVAVVDETMQPKTVSLWLAKQARGNKR